jgi:hypothetical protein
VISRRKRSAAPRAQHWAQVGRELFARHLRKLARFSGHSNPRPPKRERSIDEVGYLTASDAGSDLDLSRARNFFFFSLGRAWARALKNPANHLSPRAKTRARAHTRLGRKFDAGLQQT